MDADEPRLLDGSSTETTAAPGRVAVELVLPADVAHVRLARLVASGLGTEMALHVDRIEDLRLVVNEACGIALECCVSEREDDALALRFERNGAVLHVEVRRVRGEAVDDPSEISVAVLDEMTRSWSFDRVARMVALEFSRGDG